MDKATEMAVNALTMDYAKFFIEDFTTTVMGQIQASASIDADYLQDFIAKKITDKFNEQIAIESINPVTRFLSECAEYAVDAEIENSSDRATYDQVKNLPSQHHEYINDLVFHSAKLYQNTIDNWFLTIIGNDATSTTAAITNAVNERVSQTETGGNLHKFTWGILSDGLWLNSALMKAFDLANIFRPNETVKPFYAQVGFDFSRKYEAAPTLMREERAHAAGELSLLLQQSNLGEDYDEQQILNLLLTPGAMSYAIDTWQLGLKDPAVVISAVSELSDLAAVLPELIRMANSMEEGMEISETVRDRLESANNAITLCLMAFEALRETAYDNSLIMMVKPISEDPIVDVFINGDTINAFQANGGIEEELIDVGTYLDPRKGIPSQKGGWDLEWFFNRKDSILHDVATMEDERLQALRANDAAIIQTMVQTKLKELTASYADAVNLPEVPNRVMVQINALARKMTNTSQDVTFSLEEEIAKLLVSVVSDPLLNDVTDRFTSAANSEDELIRQNARALTIAETAIHDGISFLTASDKVDEYA